MSSNPNRKLQISRALAKTTATDDGLVVERIPEPGRPVRQAADWQLHLMHVRTPITETPQLT